MSQIYIIEKIIKKKKVGGKVKCFVKWQGFANQHNTWEFEENIKSPDEIQDENENNKFVAIDKVLQYIRTARAMRGFTNKNFKAIREHPGGKLETNGIWVWLKDCHYYVIMKDDKFGNVIADAKNHCLSKSNKNKAEKELGLKLEVIENGIKPKESYHSAAYAIWTALNFLADTKGGEKPLKVMEKRVPTLERFINRLYNE